MTFVERSGKKRKKKMEDKQSPVLVDDRRTYGKPAFDAVGANPMAAFGKTTGGGCVVHVFIIRDGARQRLTSKNV